MANSSKTYGVGVVISLLLQFGLEIHGETPVGSESSVARVLLEGWVPAIELIKAVSKAGSLLDSQESDIFDTIAFKVALIMQVLH